MGLVGIRLDWMGFGRIEWVLVGLDGIRRDFMGILVGCVHCTEHLLVLIKLGKPEMIWKILSTLLVKRTV